MQRKSHTVWIMTFLSLMCPKGCLLPNRTVEAASILFKVFVKPIYGKDHQMVLYTVTKKILLFSHVVPKELRFLGFLKQLQVTWQYTFSTFPKYIYFQLYTNLHVTSCIQNWYYLK